MNNIPLCEEATFFFFSSVAGYWVVSTLGLLWLMLLWTFMYRFLWEHIFSVLLSSTYCLGVESPAPTVITLCLTLWGPARLFSTAPWCLLSFLVAHATFCLSHSSLMGVLVPLCRTLKGTLPPMLITHLVLDLYSGRWVNWPCRVSCPRPAYLFPLTLLVKSQ